MNQLLTRVRCRLGEKIYPSMEVAELRKIPGFTLQSLVAPETQDDWKPAYQAINLSAYFASSKPVKREPIDPKLWEAINRDVTPLKPAPTIKQPVPLVPSLKKFNGLLTLGAILIAGTLCAAGTYFIKPGLSLPVLRPALSQKATIILPPAPATSGIQDQILIGEPARPPALPAVHHSTVQKHHKNHHLRTHHKSA